MVEATNPETTNTASAIKGGSNQEEEKMTSTGSSEIGQGSFTLDGKETRQLTNLELIRKAE